MRSAPTRTATQCTRCTTLSASLFRPLRGPSRLRAFAVNSAQTGKDALPRWRASRATPTGKLRLASATQCSCCVAASVGLSRLLRGPSPIRGCAVTSSQPAGARRRAAPGGQAPRLVFRCLLPSAYCLLSTVYCLLLTGRSVHPSPPWAPRDHRPSVAYPESDRLGRRRRRTTGCRYCRASARPAGDW